jgi:molybdopterin-guanine dinucleotide biosynthesis protein A
MIANRNFIIIGATGRNTGKTEFACQLIEKYSKTHPVFGVKVTAINRGEERCPRGHKSCGVCDSLKSDYDIIEETHSEGSKDTSRLLRAGAKKVLWLKVDRNKLKNGLEALLAKIPKEALVVCESNSLRTVIEPGLFLVIRNKYDRIIKPSCAAVIHFADKIISFNKMQWDLTPERVIYSENGWSIRENATAIILAGGKSSRMQGEDKSLLPIEGKPMILHIADQLKAHFDAVMIGANDKEKYAFLGYPIVPDHEAGKGPLGGIHACLEASSTEINFITACDIPTMNIKLIRNMINLSLDVDIVMPLSKDFKQEPLYAVYKRSVTKPAAMILQNNGRRIVELLKYVKSRFIQFDDEQWYQNLNSKDEYDQFISMSTDRCKRD